MHVQQEVGFVDILTPASQMTTVKLTRLSGYKVRFSIAKLNEEIGFSPVSIVQDRNDNNAPPRSVGLRSLLT